MRQKFEELETFARFWCPGLDEHTREIIEHGAAQIPLVTNSRIRNRFPMESKLAVLLGLFGKKLFACGPTWKSDDGGRRGLCVLRRAEISSEVCARFESGQKI